MLSELEQWERTRAVEVATLEFARQARALIDAPEKWVRDNLALKSVGEPNYPNHAYDLVEPTDPEACRFCALGALMRTEYEWLTNPKNAMSTEIARSDPGSGLTDAVVLRNNVEHRLASRAAGNIDDEVEEWPMDDILTEYNDVDTRKHAEIMAWFDGVIDHFQYGVETCDREIAKLRT